MTEPCPKCKAEDCSRWKVERMTHLAPMMLLPDWKLRSINEECEFNANVCPHCKGKCCRDTDYGSRVPHMAAEVYEHWCDYCHEGTVPKPDPIIALRVKVKRAVEMCEFILSGTGPDEATAPERVLATTILRILEEVKP